MKKYFFIIMLCLSILSMTSSYTFASEKVMMIIDASGSMMGQINNVTKIVTAKKVINTVLKDWNDDNEIGLIAYGHRKKGDCKDIEVVVPMGKLDRTAFTKVVNSLQPKGKTPMTDAVRIAAQNLKFTENKSTVILISDGEETCNADPCAVASELKKSGVDFTVHVIGFDVKEQKGIAQLQCLAKNTGGEFLTAENTSSLKQALTKVVKKVNEVKTIVEPSVKKVEQKVASNAPGKLHLLAIMTEGGKTVNGTIFTVYRQEADEFGKIKNIRVDYTGYSDKGDFVLPPGEYLVTAKKGNALAKKKITISAAKGAEVILNLNAGYLNTTAVLAVENKQVDGVIFTVYRQEEDEFGKLKNIRVDYTGYTNEGGFILPAGEYLVMAKKGNASAEKKIAITAGKASALELDLNAGYLRTSAVVVQGGKKVGGTIFTVYKTEIDEFSKSKNVRVNYTGYSKEGNFTLPIGEYLITAKKGNAETQQQATIIAAKGTAVELNLNAGYLKTVAVMTEGGQQVDGVIFTVFKPQTDEFGKVKTTRVNYTGYSQEGNFTLTAGHYLVTAKKGNISVEKGVDIKAGAAIKLKLVLVKK